MTGERETSPSLTFTTEQPLDSWRSVSFPIMTATHTLAVVCYLQYVIHSQMLFPPEATETDYFGGSCPLGVLFFWARHGVKPPQYETCLMNPRHAVDLPAIGESHTHWPLHSNKSTFQPPFRFVIWICVKCPVRERQSPTTSLDKRKIRPSQPLGIRSESLRRCCRWRKLAGNSCCGTSGGLSIRTVLHQLLMRLCPLRRQCWLQISNRMHSGSFQAMTLVICRARHKNTYFENKVKLSRMKLTSLVLPAVIAASVLSFPAWVVFPFWTAHCVYVLKDHFLVTKTGSAEQNVTNSSGGILSYALKIVLWHILRL